MNDNSDLLPNLVHEDAFEMQMRGYSRRQVDEFIARCRSQIRDLEQRLARSLDEGEELRRDLKSDGLDNQFHPSYTRMVPAHHVTTLRLVGCPDPNPVHRRFFDPPRATLSCHARAGMWSATG